MTLMRAPLPAWRRPSLVCRRCAGEAGRPVSAPVCQCKQPKRQNGQQHQHSHAGHALGRAGRGASSRARGQARRGGSRSASRPRGISFNSGSWSGGFMARSVFSAAAAQVTSQPQQARLHGFFREARAGRYFRHAAPSRYFSSPGCVRPAATHPRLSASRTCQRDSPPSSPGFCTLPHRSEKPLEQGDIAPPLASAVHGRHSGPRPGASTRRFPRRQTRALAATRSSVSCNASCASCFLPARDHQQKLV